MQKKECSPIPIEIYKGVPIFNSNIIRFRVDPSTFKNLIDIREETDLSFRKIIGYSDKPCTHCNGIDVVAQNYKGDEVKIPRGIISKMIPKKWR